jgi:cytoskeletal protein CcmA (bactofilin family)
MSKPDAANKQTTVEEGTQFKGTLHSSCQVLVRGVVEGDLTAPSVIVSDTGTVVGNVKAQTIRSEGVLAGRVEADEVQLSGNVRSDTVIRAKTLEIKLQRTREKLEVTFGECILDVGDDPGAEAGDAPQPPVKGKRAAAAAQTEKSDESDDNSNSNHRSVLPPS